MPYPWGETALSSAVLVVISVILMGVSALRPATFEGLRGNTADFFAPIITVVGAPFQNIAIFFHDVTGLAQLQADNRRLLQENEKLREWYQTALLLSSENQSLRKLLDMPVAEQHSHIGARVLSDTGNTYVKSLMVSVGTRDGVEKRNAVLSGDGLAGRIVDAGDHTARVLLVTDINSRVPIVVEDTKQHAIMAGRNDDYPVLIHLPSESVITNGARIVTSGYGGVYPYGLPVGRVIRNKSKELEVVLFSDFDRLHFVRIIQTHKKK